MSNINNFTIEICHEIVQGNVVLLKKKDQNYMVGTVKKLGELNAIVDTDGLNRDVSRTSIYHIVHNGDKKKSIFVGPINRHREILNLIQSSKEKDPTKKAIAAYENIAQLRNLAQIETKDGVSKLIDSKPFNKEVIGYLMQRAVKASEGQAVKATELFIKDLKQRNLTIVNL